ncbi:MAG: hypothetical protein JNL52_10515 [Flavobacteriales bacterium]|nr:hypothetical protein [Flavobacteriales bacterium]
MDDGGWHPYGNFNLTINRTRVIDGELYAVGGFTMVDGQPCDGIAKRVGGHWEPVGDFGNVPQPYLFDVIKYDGKLVCCGNMDIVGQSYRDVYIFENGQWGPLGGGLLGTFSGGWEMIIYNGELILGGGFYLSAGNAGQCIMRWNGSIWQPLGAGTTDNTDSYNSAPNIHALAVHNGKLFVGGGFSYAGHVPAKGIAVWDGAVWCGLGSDLQMVHDIEFVGDTLLAMTWNNWIDGEYNSGGVRYLHTTYADTCSLGTGMSVNELSEPPIAVNIEHGQLQLIGLPDGRFNYSLVDQAGRELLQGSLLSISGRSNALSTHRLASGVYVIRVGGHGGFRFLKN